MGRFNKYSDGVEAQSKAEKKYLLGAKRPCGPALQPAGGYAAKRSM
jgi:hypothetical protein